MGVKTGVVILVMPYSLVIILAPRIAYLNDADDILVPRYNPVDEVTASLIGGDAAPSAGATNRCSNGNSSILDEQVGAALSGDTTVDDT